VPSNPLRAVLLVSALSLLALIGGPIASASAEVESSHITSPADPTYALFDETLAPPQKAFTVSGTTTGTGNVALICYDGAETHTIVPEVTVTGNSFSVEVEAEALHDGPCVLRAVPVGDKASLPPGSSTPFQGPRIIGSRFEIYAENKVNYDYEFEPNSLSGNFQIESVGDCALDYSLLFAPISLTPSDHLFYCNAVLYKQDSPPSGPSTRSELQIDGANAYSPATANGVAKGIEGITHEPVPGAPQVTVTKSFDPLTGLVAIREIDPIVKCAPETVFPPTTTSCKEFVSAGVQLERTWQTSNANQVALMTDRWSSTDGQAHALNALYDQEMTNAAEEGGAYRFSGASTFSAVTKGQTLNVPSGAGSIYYKEDVATPDGGDGKHPQGAIVYDLPPNNGGPLPVYRGTNESKYNGFEMPYQGTIPASGTYSLRMTFIQAYALPEVESLAAAAIAGYSPTLTIASPANGATVSSSNVTVSGSATDSGLTVAGHAVNVGAGEAWSTSAALKAGANTITAVAADQAGLSTQKSITVTYTPPPPPVAHASQVGSASGANGKVTFTVACAGAAGASCEIESALTTVEKTRHGRIVAVSARHHRPKTRSQQVSVGSSKLTIPAGQRVTIEIILNSTGKSLLARFGRLPVHLDVVLVSAGHRSTIIAQNLMVKPHKRRHHRHHHRH
jgi:hypothetical protein